MPPPCSHSPLSRDPVRRGVRGLAGLLILCLALPLVLATGCSTARKVWDSIPVSIEKKRPSVSAPGEAGPKRSLGDRIAHTALSYVGTPYRYGGETPSGFDCSGLTSYVYRRYGYELPRRAEEQMKIGEKISKSRLVPGDLVFFKLSWMGNYHVGIYVGEGRFVHSPSSGKAVEIQRLDSDYYKKKYHTARRIVAAS